MADEATDTLIDDAELVASHLISKEAVEDESFCTFWQFHILVKYASHSLSDKSDLCTDPLEIKTARMFGLIEYVAFLYVDQQTSVKSEIRAVYMKTGIQKVIGGSQIVRSRFLSPMSVQCGELSERFPHNFRCT